MAVSSNKSKPCESRQTRSHRDTRRPDRGSINQPWATPRERQTINPRSPERAAQHFIQSEQLSLRDNSPRRESDSKQNHGRD